MIRLLYLCGKAAFVSATTSREEVEGSFDSGATGAYAGADAPASVTAVLYASTASAVDV